jgi:cobalt-zinc-cadmium efflux system membrane fusion protein
MQLKKLFLYVVILAVGVAIGIMAGPRLGGSSDSGDRIASAAHCEPHQIPVDLCTRCDPELIPGFKARGDWCVEHNIPESQCDICNPELAAHAGHDHAPGEEHAVTDTPLPTSFPGLSVVFNTNQPLCPTDGSVIQLASVETAQRAGIETQPVMTAIMAPSFEAPAEVVFDQTSTTMITLTLPVTIARWLIEPGQSVNKGQPLAEVESPEMAILQGEYLDAYNDWHVHERERRRAEQLLARGLADSAMYERADADAVAAEARQIQAASRLRLAGFGAEDLESLRHRRAVNSHFTLRAPTDGVLLERISPLGILQETGVTLAIVGDPEALWIEANVRDHDLPRVHQGQTVEFITDAGDPAPVVGEIIWISQFLDPHTRTGTVRVKPLRDHYRIRAHQFGRLHIPENDLELSLLIPQDAVQWEGCCNVVFVRESADRFKPRKVRLQRGDTGHYRVTEGLSADEEIVVRGSFLLKTELKKSSIGAGCCGLEASS